MLDNNGFDHWSGIYDKNILEMQNKGYPFEGYYDTLAYIQNKVKEKKTEKVLDIGIGTGLLTDVLYKEGIKIIGIDFSDKMIEQAKEKMPNARFIKFDFNKGLPEQIAKEKFDCIISSYAMHHIGDEKKIDFFAKLSKNLKNNGVILIGDIAFETRADMEIVKKQSTNWDKDEYYMIAKEITNKLITYKLQSEFIKISSCSGVLTIWI